MRKVLYLSNIQVPYRVRFFNELAKYCDLTVLYERNSSSSRNSDWANSIKETYKREFLDGHKIGNESSFSLRIIKYLNQDWDDIIIGCYSTPVGMFANLYLRTIRKPFIMNFDGEIFADDNSAKSKAKKFFIDGASKYLIAGEKSAESLKRLTKGKKQIFPYYFSSLSNEEIEQHRIQAMESIDQRLKRIGGGTGYVLVVGQYFPYKGLDIAIDAAKALPDIRFKFVGMGKRTDLFVQELHADLLTNVEVIPFLQKEDLDKEYQNCNLLVLPSRQECWGLVVNEAASFGTPIVSTTGSGAAVEFLFDKYPFLLAKPGDSKELAEIIKSVLQMSKLKEYSKYLLKKSEVYSIQHSVQKTLCSFY